MKKDLKVYARLTGLAFELVVYVVVLLLISQWIESKINLAGLGPIFALFIALGLWVYRIIVTLNQIENQDKNAQK